MSRLALCVCAATAALAALAARPAAAADQLSNLGQTPEQARAYVPVEAKPLVDTAGPITGSLLGPADLTSADGSVPAAASDGFDTADWNLDESIGGPTVALTNKALVAKGYPTLEGLGADTQAMQQGMSMEGGSVPTGSVMNTAPLPTIVSSLVGGILPK